MIDERTEQLINRRLDGELLPGEQLELDKRLIRSPEARAMLEDYQRFDVMARESLEAVSSVSSAKESLAQPVWHRRLAGVTRTAIAAAVVLAVFSSTWLAPRSNRKATTAPPMVAALPIAPRPPLTSIEGPRHEKQRVHKDVLGVVDQETQNVYVLEMDQQQTTAIPVSMNY